MEAASSPAPFSSRQALNPYERKSLREELCRLRWQALNESEQAAHTLGECAACNELRAQPARLGEWAGEYAGASALGVTKKKGVKRERPPADEGGGAAAGL